MDYLKEMLGFLDKRGWSHDEKAQLLTFMEEVIHLTGDGSSREYEEWEEELERAREVGRMDVSIMERKGIEKGRIEGIQLREARGIQLGRTEGIQLGRAEGEAKGRAEGEAKGRAEGEIKGRTETARNLLRMGFEPDKIAQATELSLDEIKGLMAEE